MKIDSFLNKYIYLLFSVHCDSILPHSATKQSKGPSKPNCPSKHFSYYISTTKQPSKPNCTFKHTRYCIPSFWIGIRKRPDWHRYYKILKNILLTNYFGWTKNIRLDIFFFYKNKTCYTSDTTLVPPSNPVSPTVPSNTLDTASQVHCWHVVGLSSVWLPIYSILFDNTISLIEIKVEVNRLFCNIKNFPMEVDTKDFFMISESGWLRYTCIEISEESLLLKHRRTCRKSRLKNDNYYKSKSFLNCFFLLFLTSVCFVYFLSDMNNTLKNFLKPINLEAIRSSSFWSSA